LSQFKSKAAIGVDKPPQDVGADGMGYDAMPDSFAHPRFGKPNGNSDRPPKNDGGGTEMGTQPQ